MKHSGQEFGAEWTIEKRDALRKYLDAYTTALKHQNFSLVYIDAFAGSGYIDQSKRINDREELFALDKNVKGIFKGSTIIAQDIKDKPFDELFFIETNDSNYKRLKRITKADSRIEVIQKDANEYIRTIPDEWNKRGVLFLDPFGTQVEFRMMEKISRINALDTWLLFPTFALTRMLPGERERITLGMEKRLNIVYGGNDWEALYAPRPDELGLTVPSHARQRGTIGLTHIYKEKLTEVFGERLCKSSALLKRPDGGILYEFFFITGNHHPRAIEISQRIAKHILNGMS